MTFQFRDDVDSLSKPALIGYVNDLEAALRTHVDADASQGVANLRKALRLTIHEARLLAALSDGRTHTKEGLLTLIYGGTDDAPEAKIIDVFVCKVRAKIAGSGIEIRTLWGSGHYVPDTAPLKAAMAGQEVQWTDAPPSGASLRKPGDKTARGHGTVREAALSFLRGKVDEERIARVASRELCVAGGNSTNGATIIRNFERCGLLNVLEKPEKGGQWVLRLTEKAFQ